MRHPKQTKKTKRKHVKIVKVKDQEQDDQFIDTTPISSTKIEIVNGAVFIVQDEQEEK